MLEISYQSADYILNYHSATSYCVLYHFVFSVGLIYFILKLKNKTWNSAIIVLSSVNILLYVAIFYKLTYSEMVENFARNTANNSAFIIHYILLICLGFFIFTIIKIRDESDFSKFLNHKLALWVLAFCTVYILSNEVMIHGLIFNSDLVSQAELAKFSNLKNNDYNFEKKILIETKYDNVKTQIIKIGYPILWGGLSFVFLIIGIKKQNKNLRIIALSLLGLTIAKLFLFDIKNVSETGKIIAFILLGVLILIISFVYQKIKKLVIDEQPKNTDNEENI